jgi:hypothetical protein
MIVSRPRSWFFWGSAVAVLLLMAALSAAGYLCFAAPKEKPPVVTLPPETAEATDAQVRQFCGACHAVPPPDSFPRSLWRKQIRQAYDLFRASSLRIDSPSFEGVAAYYESRAPLEFPPLDKGETSDRPPVRFEKIGLRLPGDPPFPGVTNVNLVHLSDPKKLDLLVCDARRNEVLAWKPYDPAAGWRTIGKVAAPAHAEVVDLDGDGIPDVLVASLGEFYPTDAPVGGVVWFRGEKDGSFTPFTLLKDVGRVADVQAADFRGTGKRDLVVGVFGWRNAGEIRLLENHSTDRDHPNFVSRIVDDRHGTIHVPVCHLQGDDHKNDFIALISQEHETVVAFLNEGKGNFSKQTIFTAPQPAYGSSGIQVVDMNGDGRPDVLYTHGDVMDPPPLLKPYDGIQWLENPGMGKFPFINHPIANMHGVERALAADFRGNGRLDVAAVSFLPGELFPERDKMRLESVVLFEQAAPDRWVRYPLETVSCDHYTCAAGDVFGDNRTHLVTGSFSYKTHHEPGDAVTIWKKVGPN